MNMSASHTGGHQALRANKAWVGARLHGTNRERGTALIMSLVILMILTILGITAMGTASLEEKMSGNIQEGTRGFEVAESGLQLAFRDSAQFALSAPITTTYPSTGTINGRKVAVTTAYLNQEGEPPRGSGFPTNMRAYYFQQQSNVNAQVDSANIGLNTTVGDAGPRVERRSRSRPGVLRKTAGRVKRR